MKDLTVFGNNKLTMSSIEIAELTGKRHDNVLADIYVIKEQYKDFKSSPEISGLFQVSEYKAKNGKMNKCVLLSKEATLDLITGYNLQARNAINTRWQELENRQHNIPTNFLEALELAVEQQKRIMQLEHKIEQDAPKIVYHDKIKSENPRLSMNEYAKLLTKENGVKIGQNKLMQYLRTENILMKGRDATERNRPYQKYMERGYFEIEYVNTPVGVRTQPFITTKGQLELAEQIINHFS